MEALFNNLFDYNYYCNKLVIDICNSSDSVPDEVNTLFSHILNAHSIWNARILGDPVAVGPWDLQETKNWEDIHYENQRTTFGILTNHENFDKAIDYQNGAGDLFSNSIQDILFHIINHSTHHRAQINQVLKAHGMAPVVSDYIFYKR